MPLESAATLVSGAAGELAVPPVSSVALTSAVLIVVPPPQIFLPPVRGLLQTAQTELPPLVEQIVEFAEQLPASGAAGVSSKGQLVAVESGAAPAPAHNAVAMLAPAPKETPTNGSPARELNNVSTLPVASKPDRVALTPMSGAVPPVLPALTQVAVGRDHLATPNPDRHTHAAAPVVMPSLAPVGTTERPSGPVQALPTENDATLSGLLTNVLPVDFALLDSAVKSFFSRIDALGVKLTANHMEFLYATAAAVLTGALALELVRRRPHAQLPNIALQRIPYADYP